MTNKLKAIMLVDDSEIDNIINQKMIESCEKSEIVYTHTTAKSALEFLKSIEKIPRIEDYLPEYIILDINMPIMDGFQFIDEFARLTGKVKSGTKVIMLSSSQNPKELEAAESNPHVFKFLTKPLTEESVLSL